MERSLTPEEEAAKHLHKCSACGLPAYNFCYCDGTSGARDCRDRIPDERRRNCPSMDGVGTEHLTLVMKKEYEAAEAARTHA